MTGSFRTCILTNPAARTTLRARVVVRARVPGPRFWRGLVGERVHAARSTSYRMEAGAGVRFVDWERRWALSPWLKLALQHRVQSRQSADFRLIPVGSNDDAFTYVVRVARELEIACSVC